MDVFGPSIGSIGLTEKKMRRKRSNLHILKCLQCEKITLFNNFQCENYTLQKTEQND